VECEKETGDAILGASPCSLPVWQDGRCLSFQQKENSANRAIKRLNGVLRGLMAT
jgi:hypothetical protein